MAERRLVSEPNDRPQEEIEAWQKIVYALQRHPRAVQLRILESVRIFFDFDEGKRS